MNPSSFQPCAARDTPHLTEEHDAAHCYIGPRPPLLWHYQLAVLVSWMVPRSCCGFSPSYCPWCRCCCSWGLPQRQLNQPGFPCPAAGPPGHWKGCGGSSTHCQHSAGRARASCQIPGSAEGVPGEKLCGSFRCLAVAVAVAGSSAVLCALVSVLVSGGGGAKWVKADG